MAQPNKYPIEFGKFGKIENYASVSSENSNVWVGNKLLPGYVDI